MRNLSVARKRARQSKTKWSRIKNIRDADIDLSDIPETTAEMAARGVIRAAGKVVPRGKTRR